MTSKEYEILVADIACKFEHYLQGSTFKILKGQDNKWEGISTCKHQIDVSIERDNDIYLIECKKYTKKSIELSDILVLYSRIVDIQGKHNKKIKGIFFTTTRYHSGVIKFGNYYKIILNKAKSIDEFAAEIAGNVILGVSVLPISATLHHPSVEIKNNEVV